MRIVPPWGRAVGRLDVRKGLGELLNAMHEVDYYVQEVRARAVA